MLVSKQWEFLTDTAKLIRFIDEETDLTASGGELWRTKYQQEHYVARGLSETMNSAHLNRLAIDLNFFRDGKWIQDIEAIRPVGEYWESLDANHTWGGTWGWDPCHFETR